MAFEYRIEDGLYQLYDGDEPLFDPIVDVAICFDALTGTMHKHGPVERVQNWHANFQRKLRAVGDDLSVRMANEVVCISGRLPIEELNKCLSIGGYPKLLYRKLQDEHLAAEASASSSRPTIKP